MPSLYSVRNDNIRGLKVTELIQSQSGNGVSGVVDFATIPQTYKDLELHIICAGVATGSFHDVIVQINSTGGTAYYYQRQYAVGAAPGGVEVLGTNVMRVCGSSTTGAAPGMYASSKVYFPNYRSTAAYKTVTAVSATMGSFAANGQGTEMYNGFFASGSPITHIRVAFASGTPGAFTTGSKFSLYGIPN